MADLGFANRLKVACDGNNRVPTFGKGRQTWLKDEMGVSAEAVRKWFAGSRPRPSMMGKLAKVLGVDESWLALGITPNMEVKERKQHSAQMAGAVNVFMGLVQLNGGSCAFPAEGDPLAEFVSFHSIREGTQTYYHVATAQRVSDDLIRFYIPNEFERCAVIGAIPKGPFDIRFIHMPHDLIGTHGTHRGGYLVVDVKESGTHYYSGEDRWKLVTDKH